MDNTDESPFHTTESKHVELAISKFFARSPVMLFILDRQKNLLLRVNDEALRKTGRTEAELLSVPFIEFIHPDDRQTSLVALARLTEGKPLVEFRNRYLTNSGDYHIFEWAVTPDSEGSRLFAMVRDLSERVSAVQTLIENNQRLSHTQRLAQLGSLDWDLKSERISISEEFSKLYGLEQASTQITPELLHQLVHPDDRELFERNLQLAIEEKQNYAIDHRILRSDGKLIWVHSNVEIILDADGNPQSLLGTFLDITERKQTESALQESQQRLSQLFDFLPDATFAIDKQGRVIAWNQAIERLTGVPKEDVMGRDDYIYAEAFYGEKRPILVDLIFQDNETVKRNYDFVNQQGDILWCEVNYPQAYAGKGGYMWGKAAPLRDVSGEITGGIEIVRDITKQKQAEEALRGLNKELEDRVAQRTAELSESNRKLQQTLHTLRHTQQELVRQEKLAGLGGLVAGVAHEMGSPLGVGITISSSLEDRAQDFMTQYAQAIPSHEELDHFLAFLSEAAPLITRSLQSAADLINHFKQLAVDQTSARRREFKLAQVVQEVLASLQPKSKRTPHRIEIEIPSEIQLDSYPGPLGQVISNLVINALTHAFKENVPGILRITAHGLASNQVRITVSDNGSGISQANLTRVFDPFFTTRLGQGGSGLGLHIVYSITTQVLGGQVEVSSQPGEGTVFTLDLPCIAPQSSHAGVTAAMGTDGNALP